MKAFFAACGVVAVFCLIGNAEQTHQRHENEKIERVSADTAVNHARCMQGLPSCDMSQW